MAAKHPSHLDNLPTTSSSEEEIEKALSSEEGEETASSEEEESSEVEAEEAASSEEEGSSEEEEEEAASSEEEESSEEEGEEAASSEEEGSSDEEEKEAEPKKVSALPSKKPISKDPEPQSSSSESSSDSDADSRTTPNTSVRPIASKPKEDPKPKATTKPRFKPASSAKRQATEADGKESSKRAKKNGPEPSADGVDSLDDSKKLAFRDEKKLFQRVWSENDEITILEGMLEYTAKRGTKPSADASAFYEFVKNSLHLDGSKTQVMGKIRRLKKKYKNNAKRAKKGKDPTFSKPHAQKAYELSKKIWGTTEDPNGVEPVAEAAKNVAEKMEIDGNQGSGAERSLNGMVRLDKSMGVVGLEESMIKRGLELIGEEKKAELEERWREVEILELEVFVKRTELVRDQARLIWEAYKKEANDH